MDISATPILGSFLVPALDLTVKIAALLALAGLATFVLRRAAAATRHLVWLSALVASLALPAIAPLVPERVGTRYALPSAPVVATAVATAGLPTPAFRNNGALTAAPLSEAPMTDVATTAASPVRAPFPWVASLYALYLAGAAFILLQIALGAAVVRRLTHDSVVAPYDSAAGRALSAIQSENATTTAAAISLRLAPDALPMTWGWRRPVILLPAEANDWEPERLRVVLLHEIAHIVRRDWPIQMFAHLICAAYWFHPLVWLAASRLRAESERACDDRVLLAGVPADVYAEQLLAVAQLSGTRRDSAVRFAAPMALRVGLESRLRGILSPHGGRIWRVHRRHIASAALLAAIALIPLCLVRADGSSHAHRVEIIAPWHTDATSNALSGAPLADPRWTRRAFKGSVSVELVAVSARRMLPQSQGPRAGKLTDGGNPNMTLRRSWKPDGRPCSNPLYLGESFFNSDLRHPILRGVELRLRVHSRDGWPVMISSEDGALIGPPPLPQANKGMAVLLPPEIDGVWREDVAVPLKMKRFRVRLKIASGPFTQKIDHMIPQGLSDNEFMRSASSGEKPNKIYVLSRVLPGQKGRYCFFVVATSRTPGYDTRLVAVDRQGREFLPTRSSVTSVSEYAQTTIFFDRNAPQSSQIAKIRFEARPYQTIEFDNVSLYPR